MKNRFLSMLFFVSACLPVMSFAGGKPLNEGCVIAGPENAPLTIEEYVDFECVYCVKGAAAMSQVLRDYSGKVKLVLRNLPLPMHGNALPAAKAFVAVWLQDPAKAYGFQERLFTNQSRVRVEGESFFFEVAQDLGLNTGQMKKDMAGDEVAKILAEDAALAVTYGFSGTPSFRIGNQSVSGARAYDEFKDIIDRQLVN